LNKTGGFSLLAGGFSAEKQGTAAPSDEPHLFNSIRTASSTNIAIPGKILALNMDR
jgi:hypothetical protein